MLISTSHTLRYAHLMAAAAAKKKKIEKYGDDSLQKRTSCKKKNFTLNAEKNGEKKEHTHSLTRIWKEEWKIRAE